MPKPLTDKMKRGQAFGYYNTDGALIETSLTKNELRKILPGLMGSKISTRPNSKHVIDKVYPFTGCDIGRTKTCVFGWPSGGKWQVKKYPFREFWAGVIGFSVICSSNANKKAIFRRNISDAPGTGVPIYCSTGRNRGKVAWGS